MHSVYMIKQFWSFYIFLWKWKRKWWNKFFKRNVKQFFNVKNFSDKDIIKLSRDYKIEIAVDLMGYTQYSRPSLFVNRLVPIQVNYLGYPGTFGSDLWTIL